MILSSLRDLLCPLQPSTQVLGYFQWSLPDLDIPPETEDLADSLIKPPKAEADATHLALAILHRITYLLTWNCTHLANPVLQKDLIDYCNYHRLHIPVICTPELLTTPHP